MHRFSAMAKLTTNMEAQYSAAQETIRVLEDKVLDLERMVKEEEVQPAPTNDAVAAAAAATPPPPFGSSESDKEDEEDRKSLAKFFSERKKTVEGQWNDVKEERRAERERLKRAREEWEVKMKSVDTGLEKINQIHVSRQRHWCKMLGDKTRNCRGCGVSFNMQYWVRREIE